jgi:hypothetical protein
LRAADDEESTVLLGSADATELGTGGHLLARLEARVPLQAYGYRVEADRLARLAAAISSKRIAAEWWDRRDGSSERAEPQADREEPSKEQALEDSGEDGSDASSEEYDGPAGCGAVSLVNIEESVDVPVETPEPSSEVDDVESSPSAVPESPGPEATVNGYVQARDTSSSGVSSAPGNDSPTNGLTTGQLWSSATEPRPRLRGRFFGARELVYDGKVV